MKKSVVSCLTMMLALLIVNTAMAQTGNEIVRALKSNPVYISPSMEGTADVAKLESVVSKLKPFNTYIVVVRNVNGGSTRLDQLSKWLRTQVGVKNGVVIVLSQTGVRASSDRRTPDDVTSVFQSTRSLYTRGDATAFLTAFAEGIAAARATSQPISTGIAGPINLWPAVGGIALLGGVAWVVVRRNRMKAVRQFADNLKPKQTQVVDKIMSLDRDIQFLPTSEDALLAQEERQTSAELLEKSTALINTASRAEQVWRAEELLDRAIERTHRSELYVQRAKGEKVDVPKESVEEKMRDKKEFRLNGCFFCSKPEGVNMEPVEMTLGNTQKRVYACHDCAEKVKRGEQPLMATISSGDRRRPWYEADDYDPRYQYGSYGGMDMFSMMVMSDIMFGGWGHAGYGNNGGWNDNSGGFGDGNSGADNVDFGNTDFGGDAGGGDFDIGGFDGGDIGDIGGGDF